MDDLKKRIGPLYPLFPEFYTEKEDFSETQESITTRTTIRVNQDDVWYRVLLKYSAIKTKGTDEEEHYKHFIKNVYAALLLTEISDKINNSEEGEVFKPDLVQISEKERIYKLMINT